VRTLSLVVATRNLAKIEQLANLLLGAARVLPLPSDAHIDPEIEADLENGDSIRAIAERKAAAWSEALPERLVIATDGGLLVPGLGASWDPLRTKRFAGESASDLDRANQLIDLAEGLDEDDRQIWWQEALALAAFGQVVQSWTATSGPGVLARYVDPELIAQSAGFWVPAVWRSPAHDLQQAAELPPSEFADVFSHWPQLAISLRRFLSNQE
jgi:inosine/xanthosine triphosphate pyrophosphatase family protein